MTTQIVEIGEAAREQREGVVTITRKMGEEIVKVKKEEETVKEEDANTDGSEEKKEGEEKQEEAPATPAAAATEESSEEAPVAPDDAPTSTLAANGSTSSLAITFTFPTPIVDALLDSSSLALSLTTLNDLTPDLSIELSDELKATSDVDSAFTTAVEDLVKSANETNAYKLVTQSPLPAITMTDGVLAAVFDYENPVEVTPATTKDTPAEVEGEEGAAAATTPAGESIEKDDVTDARRRKSQRQAIQRTNGANKRSEQTGPSVMRHACVWHAATPMCMQHVCGMCVACVWHVCGMCVACVWHPCVACVWHVCGMCVACVWHVCGMCVACVWHPCVACVWHVCGMCVANTTPPK